MEDEVRRTVTDREGQNINLKKTQRIHRELDCNCGNKTPKRGVKAKVRDDREAATQPNETWAMDCVHDQLLWAAGSIRVLTVVDTFTRYVPVDFDQFVYEKCPDGH